MGRMGVVTKCSAGAALALLLAGCAGMEVVHESNNKKPQLFGGSLSDTLGGPDTPKGMDYQTAVKCGALVWTLVDFTPGPVKGNDEKKSDRERTDRYLVWAMKLSQGAGFYEAKARTDIIKKKEELALETDGPPAVRKATILKTYGPDVGMCREKSGIR